MIEANDRLDAVFRNLLNNAVQHNHGENPIIPVSTTVSEGRVVVRLGDNSPGVPDDREEAIFGTGQTGLDNERTCVG